MVLCCAKMQARCLLWQILLKPFKVYGVIYENGFHRMPEAVAKSVSTGVNWLHTMYAGGRVRFKTGSPYVVINAKLSCVYKMSHFAFTGSIGYIDERGKGKGLRHYSTFIPPENIDHEKLMELAGDEGTVDYCHPNDLSFYSMAKALGDVLAEIFK